MWINLIRQHAICYFISLLLLHVKYTIHNGGMLFLQFKALKSIIIYSNYQFYGSKFTQKKRAHPNTWKKSELSILCISRQINVVSIIFYYHITSTKKIMVNSSCTQNFGKIHQKTLSVYTYRMVWSNHYTIFPLLEIFYKFIHVFFFTKN